MPSQLRPDNYARHTLERYTGSSVNDFCNNIILVNFSRYIKRFSRMSSHDISYANWGLVHWPEKDITMINYGVGSPVAGIVMHCLSYLDELKTVLMLGMCGGIADDLEIGDLVIPTASIRDEGTSAHYLPKDVPALPNFGINKVAEQVICNELGGLPKTGIMHTTDYRMWEFDQEFIQYILKHRIVAIDMEIATLFSVGYALDVPTGSIMLVSDLPLRKGGIKSKDSAREIFQNHIDQHLDLAIKVIEELKQQNYPVR